MSQTQQSQRIAYTVTGYNFTEISSGKGSIEYQLMDEYGNERTVTAMAKLNLFKKVSKVRPIYHRESPLIEALSRTKLNDSIVVDFSEFNKNNPRPPKRSAKVTQSSVNIKQANGSGSRNRQIDGFGSIFHSKLRLLQLMLLSVGILSLFNYLSSKLPPTLM